jgi:hypothetical protein
MINIYYELNHDFNYLLFSCHFLVSELPKTTLKKKKEKKDI